MTNQLTWLYSNRLVEMKGMADRITEMRAALKESLAKHGRMCYDVSVCYGVKWYRVCERLVTCH